MLLKEETSQSSRQLFQPSDALRDRLNATTNVIVSDYEVPVVEKLTYDMD